MTESAPVLPASASPPRRDRTSLATLELLVATDRHGSISAAARALGVSQPSASAGMRRLERHLGLELVTRSTRGARLTETGRAAATWAREVIEASDRFETSAAALREAPSARIRLAASLTIAEYLAPRWLARLATDATASAATASAPTARTAAGSVAAARGPAPVAPPESSGAPDVELLVRNSRTVMELVLDDEADLGFIESSTLRRGLRSRTIAHDELLVVVGPTHPWAARRHRSVSVDELLSGGLVVREQGSGTRETLEKSLVAAGARLPDHLPYLGSTASLKTAVQYGGAVAVLSRLTVADDLERGTLVRVDVPGLDLSRRLRMIWKDGTELSAPVRRIAAVAAGATGPTAGS